MNKKENHILSRENHCYYFDSYPSMLLSIVKRKAQAR